MQHHCHRLRGLRLHGDERTVDDSIASSVGFDLTLYEVGQRALRLLSLGDDSGDCRQDILNAVIELSIQRALTFFSSFALADIDKQVDPARQRSGIIEERCREGEEWHAGAIRTLRYCLDTPDWPSLSQRHCHRAFIVLEGRA